MNFTPFGTTFSSSLPNAGAVAQFTTAKFAHQVSGGGGQVLGVLSADEAGVTYLRPVDANGLTFNIQQATGNATDGSPQIITLPISVPGAKPGDLPQQQTLQIQVVNPNPGAGGGPEKYALPISLQPFQQGGATVLTVAYSNPHHEQGEAIQLQLQADNNTTGSSGNSKGDSAADETIRWDGGTVQVLPTDVKGNGEDGGEAQAYPVAVVTHLLHRASTETITADKEDQSSQTNDKEKDQVKREEVAGENFSSGEASSGANSGGGSAGGQWQSVSVPVPTTAMADYLSRIPPASLPLSLHHFLKFSAETIKRESAIESSPLADPGPDSGAAEELEDSGTQQLGDVDLEENKEGKKKKKYKKKAPKPRRPRPGQVQIAVALDGTTLFCCPECNMAYPDKEMLEQHLVAHKIERRFICDICGAGLKRKEHLERHKLGHNPERPYICSVCCKGFKRKEHLNLHFVIHSGEKSEVCPECGKGFHRKDHLRKHARSHLAKRVKEETVVGVPGIEEGLGDVGDTQDSVQH
ncbi:uncharacterized protein [Halyomorpha halys]|uniref:uncharacterized protein n=1 Tax=Halyomorpha halys TaxID=286706 RepID=UPI0006D5248A|nr:telomere zinc finger-associated protein-like [Halyomorpha halys]XP_014270578.1 telomere zinc finger-associated protein-like [Halyomorpha halys]XP_014270579.1 telomere zinc finger-associated protein-like [Halyomorpha halys]